MPALVLFGRKWLIGTDDLVFPGLFELLLRSVWLALVIVVTSQYYNWTYNCQNGGVLVRSYLMGMLIVLSVVIVVLAALVNRSAQGAICDTEARKLVPALLMLKMMLIGPEIAMNVLGSIWAFTTIIDCREGSYNSTAIKIMVLVNWALFAVTVIGLALLMDPMGSVKNNQETLDLAEDNLRHKKNTRIWIRRFRWFFCWVTHDEHSREAFSQVAGLLSTLFRGTDIIPTDFIAGCILLRVKQKRECREQRRLALGTGAEFLGTSDVKECFIGKPSWMCLKKANHYMKLSMAMYSWPFYIYTHCLTGLFKLIPKFVCCSCFRTKPTLVEGDNCCLCNLAAVRLLSGLSSSDILFASFKNHIFELPFAIIADHKTKSIVITIRGSLSLRDVFTDLTAAPEKTNIPGLPKEGLAHKGMLSSAKYIMHELQEHSILEEAFSKYPFYTLTIAGHSLGAGTGVLLAFMLRSHYPDLKVYAFACPGGMVTRDIAELSKEFTLSVGIGDDLVMRIGIEAVEDLRSNMLQVLHSCRLPKYRIFLNGFGYAFFGVPSRDLESTWKVEKFSNSSQLTQARHSPLLSPQAAPSTSYSLVPQKHRDVFSRRFCKTRLYMPGHILHITRKKRTKEERRAARKLKVVNGDDWELRWASPDDFHELRIMPRMFADHLPENVLKIMDAVLSAQRTEIGLDIAEITVV